MTSQTAVGKLAYWDNNDRPDIGAATLALAASVERGTVNRFPNAAARNTALTGAYLAADTYGGEGIHSYLADVNQVQVYDGTAWRWVPYVTPWITIPMFTGWTVVSGTIPGPRYRRFAGKIEFDGGAYYSGALVTTGTRLSAPQASLAPAVPSGAGNFMQFSAGTQRNANNITMQLMVQEDGSLYAMPSANVSGATIMLQGCAFADAAIG